MLGVSSGMTVTKFIVLNSIRVIRGATHSLTTGIPGSYRCIVATRAGKVPLTTRLTEGLKRGACLITEGSIGTCVSSPVYMRSRSVAAVKGRGLCLSTSSITLVHKGGILLISSIVDANKSVGTLGRLTRGTNTRIYYRTTVLTRNSTTGHSSVMFLRRLPLLRTRWG